MFQAISDMIRDAGAVEHRLYPAQPRKAKVAVMLSRAADTWDSEDKGGLGGTGGKYNANNEERKAIWMALRHAHVPVDMITDEDVAQGRLRDYRVLYLVGSEMLGSAVRPLKQWVRGGGILYATGGGGLLDEYRQPQPALLALYGLKSQTLVRTHRWVQPRNFLPDMTPLDTVAVTGPAALDFPVLCYREELHPRRTSGCWPPIRKTAGPPSPCTQPGKERYTIAAHWPGWRI